MQVRKRNGDTETGRRQQDRPRRRARRCTDLDEVDPLRVATRTISGLYDGATTAELDRLSIQTAAEMIGEEPEYSRLAARLLAGYVDKEVPGNQGVASFSQAVALGHAEGLIGDETAAFVQDNARKLDFAIDPDADRRFEYFGLRTVYDRYLLRHPTTRQVIETPQYFLLRVACGLAPARRREAIRVLPADVVAGLPAELARPCSTPAPGTPRCPPATWSTPRATSSTRSTTASAGRPALEVRRRHRARVLAGPLPRRADPRHQRAVATGSCRSCARSTPRSPRSTRAAGARARPASTSSPGTPTSRSSSSCATTPARTPAARTTSTWPTGCPTSSCAGSRPTSTWSLIDPDQAPELPDLWGAAFDEAYRSGRGRGAVRPAGPARELYGRMMRTLAQTGNGWMTFKDAANRTCNQTADAPGNTSCTCPTCAPRSSR